MNTKTLLRLLNVINFTLFNQLQRRNDTRVLCTHPYKPGKIYSSD